MWGSRMHVFLENQMSFKHVEVQTYGKNIFDIFLNTYE